MLLSLLAARDCFQTITAVEPDASHARAVLDLGIADEVTESVPVGSSAVLLACPSDRIVDWLVTLREHPATIFDAGSVKGSIIHELESRLGSTPGNYVPTHPIAGLEKSGPLAADANLFRDRMVVITPVVSTDQVRKAQVIDWWQAAGARVEEMDPFNHDSVYALTSHLPHLLAFAYLNGVSSENLAHAGGGFRDFSRIGGSDPNMWAAIFDMNRPALLTALDAFESDLAEFRSAIETADVEACRGLIDSARKLRLELK